MLCEQFLVDARLVVETFGKGFRRESRKISIALEILGQQDQMMIPFLAWRAGTRAILAVAECKISLASDNRLDAARFHRIVKSDRAIHVAMIGHGAGIHAQRFQALRQRFDLNSAVEKAVVGVQVKVSETVFRHNYDFDGNETRCARQAPAADYITWSGGIKNATCCYLKLFFS